MSNPFGMSDALYTEIMKSKILETSTAETPPVCVACGYAVKDAVYVLKEGKAYHAIVCTEAFEARRAKEKASTS